MPESLQHKLDRVRSPRVHITYDVETGGAIEKKELPFVMGVFGDFTGMPEEPLPRLKDRKFVEIGPDNFDSVLAAMKPHLQFKVENKLSEDPNAGQLGVDLHTVYRQKEAVALGLDRPRGAWVEMVHPLTPAADNR